MSILRQKKLKDYADFFVPHPPLLLWRHITNCAVNPFAIIPAFDIFKDCPPGFFDVMMSMEINILLF